jgi:hypothetical protein
VVASGQKPLTAIKEQVKAGTILKQDAQNQIAAVKDTLPDQPQDCGANGGK